MKASLRHLLRQMLRLGSGEALARVCGIITLLFLARRFGVILVGVYALGQTMAQYSLPFIDFGLRHVGARLVAQYPQAARQIVQRVQRRRVVMAFALLPFLTVYAASTRLPWNLKACLLAFAATCTLHALSLDWLAWGRERLGLIGVSRGVIPLSILIFAVAGRNSANVLWWVVLGHVIGVLSNILILWAWWRGQKLEADELIVLPAIHESLSWQRTSILGLATLCTLAFNSIDMLMLGLMSNPRQLGLYSASYRVVNQVLYTYYLLTQVLYPQLARQDAQTEKADAKSAGSARIGRHGNGHCCGAGSDAPPRGEHPVRSAIPSRNFAAAVAGLATPLDFLTSYLNNAYLAWGMEKKLLLCTIVAAGTNAVLNFIWIPAYGAAAAAVNTLLSYVIYLACLGLVARYAKELADGPQPQTVATT